MNDETKVYLCGLLGERMSDLEMTMEDNPESSDEHIDAYNELLSAQEALACL